MTSKIKYCRKRKVIEAFKSILDKVFHGKYEFDENELTLKLIKYKKSGAEKILSDGEKNVLAFCYFIASIHYKAESLSEFKKLLLVIDDPVNSLCDDFIYQISEILRFLAIDEKTEDKLTWSGNNTSEKLPFIIFTHSYQFFSICVRNNIATNNGKYYLMRIDDERHKLISQEKYFSIFEKQIERLKLVRDEKIQPDFTTGNTISKCS